MWYYISKYLLLKIGNSAITVLKPSSYAKHVLHFLYMHNSNIFSKSALKYLK